MDHLKKKCLWEWQLVKGMWIGHGSTAHWPVLLTDKSIQAYNPENPEAPRFLNLNHARRIVKDEDGLEQEV